MHIKILTGILLAFIFLTSPPARAQQRGLGLDTPATEKRVALVIGNSAYEAGPLRNPVNDARDVAGALEALGFEIVNKDKMFDLSRNDMRRAIRSFGEKLRGGGGVGLFYYAGHGMQVKGVNYLIPVDARLETEEEVEYEAVDAGFVLAQMEAARNSANILILDACRNNPFARSFRSADKGLAQMTAPSGTIIAYATAPGSVAADGSGRNGLYTQELLKNMRTGGLSIEEVFKRVRISVRGATDGKQTPWEASSLTGDFYFVEGRTTTLFREDFSSNERAWYEVSGDERVMARADGVYKIENRTDNFTFSTKPVAIDPDGDFKIEGRVSRLGGVENYGFGLMWGGKNGQNFYTVLLTGVGEFGVWKVENNQHTLLIPWTTPDAVNKLKATNKLTVTKVKNQLRFFVNDSFVGQMKFEPFFGNNVGFIVYNRQTVSFDDLTVTTGNN